MHCLGEYPGVIMTIVLKRKINYHLLQTYLPSGMLNNNALVEQANSYTVCVLVLHKTTTVASSLLITLITFLFMQGYQVPSYLFLVALQIKIQVILSIC